MVGPVRVRDRAHLTGIIQSESDIVLGNGVRSGSAALRPFSALEFGAFPELIWRPTGVGADSVHLEPGRTARVSPGAFSSLVVKSRANLILEQGDYYVDVLQLEPQSVVTALGHVRLFVRTNLVFRGGFVGAGYVQLTYGGTGDVYLESNFKGDFVAPRALVTLGSGNSLAFEGTLSAKDIVIRPDVNFTCRVN